MQACINKVFCNALFYVSESEDYHVRVMNVQCPTQYIPLEPVWIGDKSISPQGYCYGPQIS